ncbi:hypothetical protein D6C90_01665 [Aureobasidium pullulans]|uniref:Uncharacterized protein n=1 Tax=Aureobasidium pullulans TaxID=5580 RepID=A0A4S9VHR6_AURPU|nr:hypothetical protein D6C90_01665 [Aureobasidium pullulans]
MLDVSCIFCRTCERECSLELRTKLLLYTFDCQTLVLRNTSARGLDCSIDGMSIRPNPALGTKASLQADPDHKNASVITPAYGRYLRQPRRVHQPLETAVLQYYPCNTPSPAEVLPPWAVD